MDLFFTKFTYTVPQEHKLKKCPCSDPMCVLMVYDNGFEAPEERLPNVVYVDFVNKKRL